MGSTGSVRHHCAAGVRTGFQRPTAGPPVAVSTGTMKLVSVLGLSLTAALAACATNEGSSSSSLTQEPGNCGSIETHVIGIREGFHDSASVHIKRTGKQALVLSA